MDPLDELLRDYVTPVLRPAGFRKSRRRYLWVPAPGSPDNTLLVLFRMYRFDPSVVGFWIEWSAIPAASIASHAERADKTPTITWGVVADRVERGRRS